MVKVGIIEIREALYSVGLLLSLWSFVDCRKSEGFLVEDIRVDCSKDGMLVKVDFHEPFSGIIYSRGHYENPNCRYILPNRRGAMSLEFQVPLGSCGTVNQLSHAPGQDMHLENTIIIQGDPDIQESWDLARRIRCVWRHTFARTVTAKPFQVFQPVTESPSYAESHVNAVMEVQEGRGPFSKPASGYLHIGEESSLVVYLQDPSHRFDARMVDCRATGEGRRSNNVVLIDGQGCPVRPELISPFTKTRDTRNTGADLIMFTNFRAFRLSDSSSFNIRCNMQVCDKVCPDRCHNKTRVKREEPRGIFKLERGLKVLSDDEIQPIRQVCLFESSWIAMSGAVTAGYLFLLVVVWILFCKMRAYSRLVYHSKIGPVFR